VRDTEGAGRFRGAPGCYVEFGPIEGCTMRVLYTADGTVNPAAGARGGGPGGRCEPYRREPSGELVRLPACGGVELRHGERVASISSGGGGYGSPLERAPARVKHDLDEGWISRERAEGVYGLVLDAAGGIDQAATAAKRAELARTAAGA
jgi:N-methylhydantoinase B